MDQTRKPSGTTWEGFAERRIREAEAAGAFANLPGFGQPIPGIDDPPDENWWVKQKLRNEGLSVVPPVLEARLARERVLGALVSLSTEQQVREQLSRLNEQILRAVSSIVAGPPEGVALVDVEAEVARWKSARRPQAAPTGPGSPVLGRNPGNA